jgi:hypothetical protein
VSCGDRLPRFTAEQRAMLMGSVDFLCPLTSAVTAAFLRFHFQDDNQSLMRERCGNCLPDFPVSANSCDCCFFLNSFAASGRLPDPDA